MTTEEGLTETTDDIDRITLVWKNLTVRTPIKIKKQKTAEHTELNVKMTEDRPMKTIVENLTGVAKPNEIIGLLGPSGSGKTVLLNIFSSRLHLPKGSEYERNVYVNKKQPLTRDLFGKVAAYVMQDDVLLETLTPYECIKFSANLRLSGNPQEKESRVTKVIEDLRLKTCMNTLVSHKK
jgi:ABC-type multidrug transport system ATPase subunit